MKANHARRTFLRSSALAGAMSLTMFAGAMAADDRTYQFDMPAQPLGDALRDFARAAGEPIVFREDLTAGRTAPAIRGAYTADQALDLILADAGLKVMRSQTGVYMVQDPQGGSAGGGAEDYAVEALVVTAQKKEEQIQDVPIAISAFTQKSLDAQKIEGGFDLLKAIPNVTFSKSNFSGYNFSIRGIGTKAVSATTDPGVAVAFNNTTLIVNRLFEQEYFDVERVEVLRGPQGTLYGRNATSGVINVLAARPRMMAYEGEIELEAGNYNAQRVRGMVNVPIGDTLALRVAGATTKRDGYGYNEFDGSDVDNRDLWSLRTTLGWEPIEQIRVNLMWERFEEDDERVRTSKQLCHYDPGPESIGGLDRSSAHVSTRALTSQGCLPGSLYADEAFGTPNGASIPYIYGPNLATWLGNTIGVLGLGPMPSGGATFLIDWDNPDPYGGRMQSRDLRTIHSALKPEYRATSDVFELSIDLDLTDSLTVTSQTVFAQDEYYATQDYNRFGTEPIFNDSALACAKRTELVEIFPGFFYPQEITDCSPELLGTYAGGAFNITPGGVFTDPQLGPSRSLVAQDLSKADSEQFNQELRIASNFDSAFNFSLGGGITRFETLNDYYVFANTLTAFSYLFPFAPGNPITNCPTYCAYVDPNPLESINGEGHNYFRSANPYELNSSAIFGELYWQATDTVKVTLGARMTWDRKVFTPIPSQLLLSDYRQYVPEGAGPGDCQTVTNCQLAGTGIDSGEGARGAPPNPDIVQEWREPTGRIIVDWKPDLGFTDETMIYGTISHGYKGGGANPPGMATPASIWNDLNTGATAPKTFEPEFIDAYEIGTKNTLLGGALVLNGAAFYYDYEGYQVSKIVDRSAANENFDAKVWGAELEWIYAPTRNLRFNGSVGYLQTEIAEGERSIDLMDRTQGGTHSSWVDANGVEHQLEYTEWVVLKPWVAFSSNCVAPAEVVAALMTYGPGSTVNLCPGGGLTGIDFRDNLTINTIGNYDPTLEAPNGGAGFFDELGGNELPNAPHWTASLGAQYRFALPGGWDGTVRGDFYWQDKSFARVYNTEYDRLEAWTNANLSFWVENLDWGVTAEVYVKNVFDETPITDAFLNSDDSGLTTNVFTLDPRLVGVSVRKSF